MPGRGMQHGDVTAARWEHEARGGHDAHAGTLTDCLHLLVVGWAARLSVVGNRKAVPQYGVLLGGLGKIRRNSNSNRHCDDRAALAYCIVRSRECRGMFGIFGSRGRARQHCIARFNSTMCSRDERGVRAASRRMAISR